MLTQFEPLIKLSDSEEKKFASFIQEKRKQLIKSPKEAAKMATQTHQEAIESLLKKGHISEAIVQLRQYAYDEFLKEESLFNGVVLSEIGQKFDTPKAILETVSSELFKLKNLSASEFNQQINQLFGTYAGHISPYIYQLCLSNTQSRRSRAGKVFEGIIYSLYEYFDYAYDSQSAIGKKAFSDLKLGKVVDSILPSTQAFSQFRNKTIVGSMKTTLRERWQEVVEEIQRSNLPNIYLLTVDTDISDSKAEQMAQHNIVLVVLESVKKQTKLKDKRSIIDFESYFSDEIPKVLEYWGKDKS
ncbi:MAG: type II restriction endonuclease [Formosimonas sp.]